ncbi:MAG: cadherin repeat domain-containing protein, partial [Phreatobacter sp.]|uniref:cadherin repeat domain-containing protein n=1 Tax=Phreatobacter sp. TaxID=1966341 RepID=UPI00403678B3
MTAPVDADAASNSIAENAAAGTKVGITASAFDADATTSGVTYSLANDAGGRFVINAATGEVSVAAGASFDRESESAITVAVTATSQDGSASTQSFAIAVTDVDEFDVTPVSDSNAAADAVTENAAIGTTVGVTAFASDGDATNSGVTYALTDDAGGRFAIDATTGVVTVAGAIDREAGATQAITVRATSADGSTATQSYSIAVGDADEFDVTPVADSNAAANAVTENAATGTTVGITAFASDGDATNSGVTYALTDDAGGRFAIDATTGVVTVAGAIDREAGATQAITVRATSADGSTATQSYSIAINDADEFDVSPVSDSN